MMTRGTTIVLRSVSTRLLSTAAGNGTVIGAMRTTAGGVGFERAVATWWIKTSPVAGARRASTVALGEKEQQDHEKETVAGGGATGGATAGAGKGKEVVSYWGVQQSKITPIAY